MPDLENNAIRVRPAIVVLAGLALGVFSDRNFDIPWQLSLVAAALAVIVWMSCYVRNRQWAAMLALVTSVCFAGAFWHHGRWNWFSPQDVGAYASDESRSVCIRARILGEGKQVASPGNDMFDPIPKKERTIYLVAPEWIRNGNRWEKIQGRTNLVVHQKIDNVHFGDCVQIVGKLIAITKPTSPGQFDFQNYYRSRNQTAVIHAMFGAAVVVEERAGQFSNASVLSEIRSKLNSLIWQHVDADHAGFAGAILLGNREQLSRQQRESFLTTGTAHLLAISGLHVGILASLFLLAYRIGILKRRWALLLTILFVVFYAWLVEFRPPVSRAAILLTLFCSGRLIGRSGNEFNLLAMAGIIVLIMNPSDLFQLGPQLSFLAVATLVVFKDWIFPPLSNDPIQRLIRNTRPWLVRTMKKFGRACQQAVMVSTLIWLLGLPLVAAHFHLVTPVSVVINPFVLLPIAVALFAGLGVCVFGFWLPRVADFCGWICGSCLNFVSEAIDVAERVPAGHWWTAGPTLFGVVMFYLLLLLITLVVRQHRERLIFLVCGGWLLLGWMLPFHLNKFIHQNFPTDTSITFVDVGHGCSVLLQMPVGQTVLYDAGSIASAEFATETVSNVLWSEQIEHLDAIIISHADLDHFNAIPKLVERFSIGMVYVSFPMSDKKSELVDNLMQCCQDAGIPVRNISWHDIASLPMPLAADAKMKVLLPPEFGTGGNDNSDSIVLMIDVDGQKVLLPGDLEGNGMQLLLGTKSIDCDLVMLPHHGSKNSRPVEFVGWCTPEQVVISAGKNKLDIGVVDQLSALNCDVLSTAKSGAIRARLAADGIRLSRWSGVRWSVVR